MRLWFDDMDERGCPDGWVRAKNVDEAIEFFKSGEVVECSLDHDIESCGGGYISGGELNGNDLVNWMLSNLAPLKWPHTIHIHSWNPSGAGRMAFKLKQSAPVFVEVKVKPFFTGMIREINKENNDGA